MRTSLQTSLRILTATVAVVFLLIVAVGVFAWFEAAKQRRQLETVAVSTANALCVLRRDLEVRVENTQEFLDENPDGIPGISSAQIEMSIRNQQETIEALADLRCPPTEVTED
jgi:hypothetical protein